MFGIGIQEMLLILVVALLVLGPTKLPGVARSLGKGLKELRKASDDLRTALMFDDDDPPKRRYPTAPSGADAALASAETANAAPGIHGSLAAGAGAVAGEPDDDGPGWVPAEADTVVSRGQSGGDPHKRALDPAPRLEDVAPRHEPVTDVPADPEATALLDDARREAPGASAVTAAKAAAPGEKDVTP